MSFNFKLKKKNDLNKLKFLDIRERGKAFFSFFQERERESFEQLDEFIDQLNLSQKNFELSFSSVFKSDQHFLFLSKQKLFFIF